MTKRLLSIVSMLLLLTTSVWAQDRSVSGTISDVNGDPLPGVSILIKGTTQGTVSSFDGNYKLSLNSNEDVLVFRFVGYTTQEIVAGTQSKLDVTMEENAEELQEVVIVGYSKQDVSSSTPAVENVTEIVTPSLANAIQGKATGVQVTASSGQPGAKNNIVIRGVGSLSTNSDPLYVVDGVILNSSDAVSANQQSERDPLASINPADIDDIKILKDAAATAQYGARAANGVIIVTTKRGKAGKTKIGFNTKIGVSDVNYGNWGVLNAQQFREFHGDDTFQDGDTNTDWAEEAFRQGTSQTYELSAAGGSDKTRFYASGGYFKQEGILVGSDFERSSARLNLDHDFNKFISFTLQTNVAHVDQVDASDGNLFSSPLLGAQMNIPTSDPYNEDGTTRDWLSDNPIGANFVNDYDLNSRRTRATTGNINSKFNVFLTDWLTLRQSNSMNAEYVQFSYYVSPESYDGRSENGSKSNDNINVLNYMNTTALNFDKSWDKHNLSGVLAYEYNRITEEEVYARGINMPVGLQYLNSAAEPSGVAGYFTEVRYISYIAQASYNYDGKYYLSSSIRRDGSSKFGADNQYGNFWSVAGSWFLSREDFLEGSSLTEAKLRASYGTTGNANIDNFESRALYGYRSYDNSPAAYYSQLGNPTLTWEQRKKMDVGFDLAYKNKLRLNVSYYSENSEDLLLNQQVSSTTGFKSVRTNIGKVRNSGWEANISYDLMSSKDFKWTSSLNVTTNTNEVVDLDGQEIYLIGDRQVAKEGSAMRTWTLREWAGADPETGAPSWYVNEETPLSDEDIAAGPYYMRDGRLATTSYSAANRVDMGSAFPKAVGGWSNNFSYKGIDLSVFLTYSFGGKIYNGTRRYSYGADGAFPYNLHTDAYTEDRWEEAGDMSLNSRAGAFGGHNHSSRFLEDGDYISLRNVTLGYTLPRNIAKKLHTSNVRIYASGQNLYIWAKEYSGFSPATVDATGDNFFEYPEGRTMTVGLNVEF